VITILRIVVFLMVSVAELNENFNVIFLSIFGEQCHHHHFDHELFKICNYEGLEHQLF
jgi:hypothetical protein